LIGVGIELVLICRFHCIAADTLQLVLLYQRMLFGVKSVNKDFICNVSSRYLRKEFVVEVEKVDWKDVFWANGYFIASCGGVTVEQLKKYIKEQDIPVK